MTQCLVSRGLSSLPALQSYDGRGARSYDFLSRAFHPYSLLTVELQGQCPPAISFQHSTLQSLHFITVEFRGAGTLSEGLSPFQPSSLVTVELRGHCSTAFSAYQYQFLGCSRGQVTQSSRGVSRQWIMITLGTDIMFFECKTKGASVRAARTLLRHA